MLEEAFKTGRLLLPTEPSAPLEAADAAFPWLGVGMAILFVLLFLLLLQNFLHILPYLSDSMFRARGSTALDSSVRVSRDRNIIALILILPLLLVVYRYRVYDPAFLRDLSPSGRLGAIGGAIGGFLLLRFLLTLWLKPRRRSDGYMASYRAGYTFFILLMIFLLPTLGLLYVFHAPDGVVRTFFYVELAVVYGLYLVRRVQILSLSCRSLTTFLYLCALELLPSALLIVSAAVF